MIRSMTGYGRAQTSVLGMLLGCEIRSVNNRYFDINLRLPKSLSSMDETIRKHVKSAIIRGKVEVSLSLLSYGSDMTVALNTQVVDGYLEVARELSVNYGLSNDMTVTGIMRLPDVICLVRAELDEQELTDGIIGLVSEALENLTNMRIKEGQTLASDILERSQTIETLTSSLAQRAPQLVFEYRAKLEKRISDLLGDASVEPARILTEAAIFADKVAVDEELVRLGSHINQLREAINRGGEVGRKLDFLIQELNREANTIGSKITDMQCQMLVIDIKSQLEKIREQVQNIE